MAGSDHGTAGRSSPPTAGVFDGVRVLSLAEQLPGPFAGMLLADLGADVILVERPGGGDPARAFPPVFQAMAPNKRSVCNDLKSDDGKERFKALAHTADVVMEGLRPSVMDRLGLGYAALASVNPGLVHASMSGFGQSDPYRDRTAHDAGAGRAHAPGAWRRCGGLRCARSRRAAIRRDRSARCFEPKE